MHPVLLEGDVPKLGAIAVQLGAQMPEWIRRRKTTYTFVDDSTILQRMSVDLVLPVRTWFGDSHAPRERDTIYIPVGIAEKKTFSGFSITDREGNAVSLLNTYEDGTLAAAGFDALIARPSGADPVPGRLRSDLRAAITSPDASVGETRMGAAVRHGLDAIDVLMPGTQYRALLDDLQGGFMMMIPVIYEAGASHLFKVEWSTRFLWSGERVGSRARTVAASLGLIDKRLRFPALDIGTAHSTHFEFVAPEDVHILEGILDTGRPDQMPVTEPSQPRVDLHTGVADWENPIASRADRATASIALVPRTGGPFAAIVVLAWLTCLVLAAVTERVAQLDAQTMSAVILVVPAVLATYLVRQGEHIVTGRLLGGIRAIGLWVGALALVAAVLIGVGDLRRSDASPHASWICRAVPEARGPHPTPAFAQQRCAATTPTARADPRATGIQDVLTVMTVGAVLPTLVATAGAWSTWRRTRRALRTHDAMQTVGYPQETSAQA
jgi:hypothetical protein